MNGQYIDLAMNALNVVNIEVMCGIDVITAMQKNKLSHIGSKASR